MNVKVCGITTNEQINALSKLDVQMVGLNFYPPSKRFIKNNNDLKENINSNLKRVGVFVNSSKDDILAKREIYQLDYAQLHGDEDYNFCSELSKDISLIKVWRVKSQPDENIIHHYDDIISFHLFDTYTEEYGGSGKSFNWKLIEDLDLKKPIMLSGGISPEHTKILNRINNENIWGVDINSRFETSPGIKDIEMIESFTKQLKS